MWVSVWVPWASGMRAQLAALAAERGGGGGGGGLARRRTHLAQQPPGRFQRAQQVRGAAVLQYSK